VLRSLEVHPVAAGETKLVTLVPSSTPSSSRWNSLSSVRGTSRSSQKPARPTDATSNPSSWSSRDRRRRVAGVEVVGERDLLGELGDAQHVREALGRQPRTRTRSQ
jgi:hypothetical protein